MIKTLLALFTVAAVLTIWLPRFSRPGHRPKTYDTQGQRLDV